MQNLITLRSSMWCHHFLTLLAKMLSALMLWSNQVHILRKWRWDVTSVYRVFETFLQRHKQPWWSWWQLRIVRLFSIIWLATNELTCGATVTYILVLKQNILLLATGCLFINVQLWYLKKNERIIPIFEHFKFKFHELPEQPSYII